MNLGYNYLMGFMLLVRGNLQDNKRQLIMSCIISHRNAVCSNLTLYPALYRGGVHIVVTERVKLNVPLPALQ